MSLPEIGIFCDILKVPLPNLEMVAPDLIPEPYHHLLVHEGDMTGRLSRYYDAAIRLKTLRVLHQPGALFRQVLLQTEPTLKTVEFGAIQIHLDVFAGAAYQAVLGCSQPLGGILNEYGYAYHSELGGFVTITAEQSMADMLHIEDGQLLYGRINRLVMDNGSPIADVIEILPPA